MDQDQRVAEMLDRDAIRQLPIRYCHYVRTQALEPLVDLFAEDAEMDMGTDLAVGEAYWKGRDQFRAGFANSFQKVDPWPFVHNHIVDLTGPDSAEGFVYVEVRMADQRLRTTFLIVYEDRYVKQDEVWRFKSRRLKTTFVPE